MEMMQEKYQKVQDVEETQKILAKIISKLNLKLVADAIGMVYDIQREECQDYQHFGKILFNVGF